MPSLLMVIIKFLMPLDDHTIKKLLLIFWEIVPKTGKDGKLLQEMILVCDAYRKVRTLIVWKLYLASRMGLQKTTYLKMEKDIVLSYSGLKWMKPEKLQFQMCYKPEQWQTMSDCPPGFFVNCNLPCHCNLTNIWVIQVVGISLV